MVLIYIALIVSDVEHLFMFLLSICMLSLEKVYLDLLSIFLLGCCFFDTELYELFLYFGG